MRAAALVLADALDQWRDLAKGEEGITITSGRVLPLWLCCGCCRSLTCLASITSSLHSMAQRPPLAPVLSSVIVIVSGCTRGPSSLRSEMTCVVTFGCSSSSFHARVFPRRMRGVSLGLLLLSSLFGCSSVETMRSGADWPRAKFTTAVRECSPSILFSSSSPPVFGNGGDTRVCEKVKRLRRPRSRSHASIPSVSQR